GFGVGFGIGGICIGWMADRWNVRWLYAASVLVWSAAGFATGLVAGFIGLLMCRSLLGLAEAGNWPNALRTTQHILPPSQRTMGNGILQSGAAIGAILTPLVIEQLVHDKDSASWRYPFMAVGAVGATWVILWLLSVRSTDLASARLTKDPSLAGILGWLLALGAIDLGVHALAVRDSWLPLAGKVVV